MEAAVIVGAGRPPRAKSVRDEDAEHAMVALELRGGSGYERGSVKCLLRRDLNETELNGGRAFPLRACFIGISFINDAPRPDCSV